MRRVFFGVGLLAGVGFLVSLGAAWWVIELETGVVIALTGLSVSPAASSLMAAAAASFGVGAVLRGVWRRIVALGQAALSFSAGIVWWQLGDLPRAAALGEITLATGLSGVSALDLVVSSHTTGFLWVGIVSAVAAGVSGIVGLVMPDAPPRASRYEQHRRDTNESDPIVSWDRLSDGDDPTRL